MPAAQSTGPHARRHRRRAGMQTIVAGMLRANGDGRLAVSSVGTTRGRQVADDAKICVPAFSLPRGGNWTCWNSCIWAACPLLVGGACSRGPPNTLPSLGCIGNRLGRRSFRYHSVGSGRKPGLVRGPYVAARISPCLYCPLQLLSLLVS